MKKDRSTFYCIAATSSWRSEEYIRSIEDTVNEWFDDNVELKYGSGLSQGAVLVNINKKPFVLILALSNPLNRIKSLTIKDPAYMIMDEFICNTRMGEKYLKDEAFRFKEIYSTFTAIARMDIL